MTLTKICKHKYPYIIRGYDELSMTGKFLERHVYCFHCKKWYLIKSNINNFVLESLNLYETKPKIRELRKIRDKEINRWKKDKSLSKLLKQRSIK